MKSFLYKKAEKRDNQDFPGHFKVPQTAVLGTPHSSHEVTAVTYRNILGSSLSLAHLFPAGFPRPRGTQGGEKQPVLCNPHRALCKAEVMAGCNWAAAERRNSPSLP